MLGSGQAPSQALQAQARVGFLWGGVRGGWTSQVYFENSSWPPEQLLEPPACPLFQALSCWGTGVLCATSSLCSNSAELYSMFSMSPLLLLFMSYC